MSRNLLRTALTDVIAIYLTGERINGHRVDDVLRPMPGELHPRLIAEDGKIRRISVKISEPI